MYTFHILCTSVLIYLTLCYFFSFLSISLSFLFLYLSLSFFLFLSLSLSFFLHTRYHIHLQWWSFIQSNSLIFFQVVLSFLFSSNNCLAPLPIVTVLSSIYQSSLRYTEEISMVFCFFLLSSFLSIILSL